jgi:hypothetical protein
MDEIFTRVWHDLVARTSGPLWFRLILQPLVATVFGIRAGVQNARRRPQAESPRTLDPTYRRAMFHQAWQDAGKMLIAGVVLDFVYQYLVLRTLYPGEALLVAFLLVVVPYQLIRTIVPWLMQRKSP